MAGNFANPEHGEFNVAENVEAFGKVIQEWPTPIFLSGYEIGEHVLSKAEELRKVLKPENPVWRGYEAFFHEVIKKEPGDRPSWDQTAMLWALEPTAKHFDPSEPLIIHLAEKGQTTTSPGSTDLGDRRILKFAPRQGC